MTTRKSAIELRRCKGSARFGIEPHETPVGEFPKQPSRKDGLGVMCLEHWRAYVKGLREARRAAPAADEGTAVGEGEEAPPRSATESRSPGPRARSPAPSCVRSVSSRRSGSCVLRRSVAPNTVMALDSGTWFAQPKGPTWLPGRRHAMLDGGWRILSNAGGSDTRPIPWPPGP